MDGGMFCFGYLLMKFDEYRSLMSIRVWKSAFEGKKMYMTIWNEMYDDMVVEIDFSFGFLIGVSEQRKTAHIADSGTEQKMLH